MDEQNIDLRITASLDAAEAANSARDLKAAMRELNALAEEIGGTNEEAYLKIKQAAGDAALKVREMNESTKALAGTPLQATAGSFKLIRENLMTMNFEALSKNVTLFAGSMNKLNPSGLTEGFGKLATSLISLGKALLTNPIFLVGAAIALIITKFDELKESGGLIGKVFTGIGNVIHAVIGAITAFTDALGLTNIEGQKRSEQTLKNLEKEKDAINDRYEHEKTMAQATGDNVEKIEGDKFVMLKDNAKKTIAVYENIKKEKGELSDKETEKYEEALVAYKKIANEEQEYQAGINKKILESTKDTLKELEQAEITAMTNETAKKKAQADFDLKYEKEGNQDKLKERLDLLKAGEAEELRMAGDNEQKKKEISDKYRQAFKEAYTQTNKLEVAQAKNTTNEIAAANEEAGEKAKAKRTKAVEEHIKQENEIAAAMNKLHDQYVKQDEEIAKEHEADAKAAADAFNSQQKLNEQLSQYNEDFIKSEKDKAAAAKQEIADKLEIKKLELDTDDLTFKQKKALLSNIAKLNKQSLQAQEKEELLFVKTGSEQEKQIKDRYRFTSVLML